MDKTHTSDEIIKLYGLFFLLSSALIILFVINVGTGSVNVPFFETCMIIVKHVTGTIHGAIIWKIRMPRIFSAMFCGGYLAVAGLLLQVFFRNPIVGPYILGISSGASMMVGLVMLAGFGMGVMGIHPFILSITAFCGASLVMVIIVTMASRIKNIITLLIIGLMIGYLCNAVTSILIAFAEKEQVKGFVLWQMGSFSGFTWQELELIVFAGIPLLAGAYLMSKPLNAFLLGEDYAKTMGVNIKIFRCLIVTVSSALSGLVTAFAGPVAFIGLAVPHMARLMFRTSNNRVIIPASILTGAIVTVACDLVARTMFSPVELPLSAITSFFGAPVIIILLFRRRAVI